MLHREYKSARERHFGSNPAITMHGHSTHANGVAGVPRLPVSF